MAADSAFERVQQLLQKISDPEELKKIAQALADQNIPVPDVDEVRGLVPQPPAPQAPGTPQQAVVNPVPQGTFVQPGTQGGLAIPTPTLTRQPLASPTGQSFTFASPKGRA